jgi:hypothetical protein
MNKLINDNFFKIEDNSCATVLSALNRSLLHKEIDEELFKRWISKELNLPINDDQVIKKLNFIVELKTKLNEVKSDEDKNQIVNYLSRLTSAKFSGSKQSELSISTALEKLIYSYENKKPIIFVFGFGGYKNYNSPSFPEVDFAELFHMKYMTEFLWPIITTYKYGVKFEYEDEEISIQFNNVPQETTDRYTKSFKLLLDYFQKKIFEQNNIKLNYELIIARDMYQEEDLYNKMDSYRASMTEVFEKLSEEEKGIWLKRARTNFLIKGTKDFSKLSDEELNTKVKEVRITNECFLMADFDLRLEFWERPNIICLFGTWGKMPCASPTDGGFHLKSTKSSNIDFWIGTGVFRLNKENEIEEELILSSTQLKENNIKHMEFNDAELAKISNNFKKITYIN